MLTYNTQLKPLPLPEYGRNIQNMVDYCLTIPDRDERTRCAYSILSAMSTLFPELKSASSEYNHKLWDHLMIMSGFQLDIDFPCEVINQEHLYSRPEPVAYTDGTIRFRHYGKIIEDMIAHACQMEPSEERDEFVRLIAYQMKKLMTGFNPEAADDRRIFNDLAVLSHGEFRLDPETTKLRAIIEPAKPSAKKKKRK
ncbi:MAG: DUF4290 domain-containing protein [Paramuribaculum sp.]|nr:DUF4290 domain-containing protein [Paramuribaculum sp.]